MVLHGMAEAEREPEIPLTGGRITQGVVRVGDTVRRPVGPHSPFVHRLLRHLEDVGCEAAPRLLGIDAEGREVLSFQQGATLTAFRAREWSPAQITAAARLLRRLHDATAGTPLAGGEETVCHNDFSPLNVAFADGLPVSAFDFDQGAPGPRTRDLAYAAWLWLLGADIVRHLDHQVGLLRTFLDAYGLEHPRRQSFGRRIVARVEAERDFHARAGRVAGPGTWLHNEIIWLGDHADAIDRGLGT
ncbi:Phosphotransferase enzyme family protein [Lentzea xinjiangensis]|uniref:Phosphotransferase enzyme family protein n=1 Tax=Lentzea xinjiangensis TaxID=402600 RepID=A0A1H9LZR7_9PSEU|nr:aminoglycoside phosphotransferase family protein [Lentzea xinjiangensis]SER16819.1 Phosphotransferase enzyme family protein [Lentzea xinjiangensis]